MATAKKAIKETNVSTEKETKVMEEKKVTVAEESHKGKYRRFCANCGKEMWVDSPMIRICDECKAKKKVENAKKANKLQKERNEKLGLVNMVIQKEDRAKLKAIAAKEKKNMFEVLHEILTKVE